MKTLSKFIAISTIALAFISFKSTAQTLSPPPGDTINIVRYNSDQNFDTKRSIVYTDKHTVDSLVAVLATNHTNRYSIVYRREGKEGKAVSSKEFSKLDKTSVFRIMIAYNKKGLPDDDKPIYVLTAK